MSTTRVRLKKENTYATIIDIDSDVAIVETDDGFEYLVNVSDLEEIPDNLFSQIIALSNSVPGNMTEKPRKINSTSTRAPKVVDLHAGKLITDMRGLTDGDIHEIQLQTIKTELDGMEGKHGMKILFIHGKGDGVLRKELRAEVARRGGSYSCSDAPVEQTGFQGGTLVRYS